jgi:phosphonate transport system permease protein
MKTAEMFRTKVMRWRGVPATLVAVVPGLGHVYAGRPGRGAGIFLTIVLSALLAAWYGVAFWYAVPLLVWLWSIWDVYWLQKASPRSITLPVAAMLIMCYAMGWQVAGMDFLALTRNLNRAMAVLGPMVRPDFVSPRVETQQSHVVIEVPCSGNPPPGRRTQDGLTLAASAGCAGFRDSLTFQGSGFWPDLEVQLFWENTAGERQRLLRDRQVISAHTDDRGNFTVTVTVPQMRSGTGQQANLDVPLPERFIAIQARPLGGLIVTDNGQRVFRGILETLSLALLATTFSVFGAVPLGFLAAFNLMKDSPASLAVYVAVRTVLNYLRSIEPLIMAIVFVVIVGLGPFAGLLAILVHSIAALAKMYSEAIEGIDPGPIEAVRATGASWMEVVRYGVVPQVLPPFMSFTLYRWDINVRSSIVIGFVGGGGIGAWLFQWIIIADYRAVGAAFVAIVVVVMILDHVSARLRARIV